jgi:hypothetical protein
VRSDNPLRWRRAANSAAFTTLLILVLVLAYLALTRVLEKRNNGDAGASAGNDVVPAIEFDRFSARRERSDDNERLSVSLRLRATMSQPIKGFVFIVARNDHVSPKIWAIWPPQAAGLAITAGGHFHAATPASGEPVDLTNSWERVTAALPHPPAQPPFDTVVLYIVSPQGQILLSRPFEL